MDPHTLLCYAAVYLLLFLQLASAQTRTLLQSLTGEVSAGNYSYYRLTRKGHIQLIVKSIEGDADLYISESNPQPTYEDYDFKSATFGDEIVDIPSSSKRPVGIGIYGHPFSELSRYRMNIFWVLTDEIDGDVNPSHASFSSPESAEEEESLLWTIAINFLKILLEVLF